MRYFVGIVPPLTLSNAIVAIQCQFGNNRLEPHITVRPPVAPLNEKEWLEQIKLLCSSYKPFNVELVRTGYFGKSVLFIDARSADLEELSNLLKKAISHFEPADQQDSRPYHPHLTLGRTWCGFTKQDFEQMAVLANKLFGNGPLSFPVHFARVYHKPQSNKGYEKLEDISFGGNSR